MGYNFKLTQQANDDLDNVLDYIAVKLSNKKAALDLLSCVEEIIREVCLFPESGVLVENDFLPVTGIRKKKVKHYTLYYLPNDQEQTVIVLRFLYGKRDTNALRIDLS